MPQQTTDDTRDRDEQYLPPRAEDLGTFAELTRNRIVPRVGDNNVLNGSA